MGGIIPSVSIHTLKSIQTDFKLCLSVLNRLGVYWVGLVSFRHFTVLF